MEETVELGPFLLTALTETPQIQGMTPGRVQSRGRAELYRVEAGNPLKLVVADEFWATGERSVRLFERVQGPQRLERLCHGLRLTIGEVEGDGLIALRQARLKGSDWSNLFDVTEEELDEGAGIDVGGALRRVGATDFGPQGEIAGREGRMRNRLCVRFPVESDWVPVSAYVLTRIAPLLNGARA